MKYAAVVIAVVLACVPVLGAQQYSCESIGASMSGHWRALEDAPHDGTIVEVLNTYGVAPTYGLFRWTTDVVSMEGKHYTASKPEWQDVHNPSRLSSEQCMFFRRFEGDPAKYVDPTHGAQNTAKYWCDAMHVGYNPKTGYCTAH